MVAVPVNGPAANFLSWGYFLAGCLSWKVNATLKRSSVGRPSFSRFGWAITRGVLLGELSRCRKQTGQCLLITRETRLLIIWFARSSLFQFLSRVWKGSMLRGCEGPLLLFSNRPEIKFLFVRVSPICHHRAIPVYSCVNHKLPSWSRRAIRCDQLNLKLLIVRVLPQ